MIKPYEEIVKTIEATIPDEAISTREAYKGGPVLSYLTSFYVFDQLNKVFGHGNWDYSVVNLKLLEKYETENYKGQKMYNVYYSAEVTLQVNFGNIEDKYMTFRTYHDVGFGNGMDKSGFGPAHELAMKEAVTDGLKRAAKSIGGSLGLALYNKDRETPSPTKKITKKVPVKAKASSSKSEDTSKRIQLVKTVAKAYVSASPDPEKAKTELKSLVKTEYGVDKVEELGLDALNKLASKLKEMVNVQ